MQNFLALFALLLSLGATHADEAIMPNGPRIQGILRQEKDQVLFQVKDKSFPLNRLQSVRFTEFPCPLPKVPLIHRLLLPQDQSLTGQLLELNEREARFQTFAGNLLKISREHLVGLTHPNGWHVLHHEDFENALSSPWKFDGPLAAKEPQAFSGKKCFPLPQKVEWGPPSPPSQGRLGFFLFQTEENIQAPLHFSALFSSGHAVQTLRFSFTEKNTVPGWNLIQLDFGQEKARLSVNDFVLLTPTLPKNASLARIGFHQEVEEKSKTSWAIDDLVLYRSVPNHKPPALLPDLDTVWWDDGDQVFGKVLQANSQTLTLEAKFGTRSYPWSAVRGFFLSPPPKNEPRAEVAITFFPGPGHPPDRLLGKLHALDSDNLILQHGLLGKVVLKRECCQRLTNLNPARE
jgi:hypothetical protein